MSVDFQICISVPLNKALTFLGSLNFMLRGDISMARKTLIMKYGQKGTHPPVPASLPPPSLITYTAT